MQAYYDARSETWQQGERAAVLLEQIESLEQALEALPSDEPDPEHATARATDACVRIRPEIDMRGCSPRPTRAACRSEDECPMRFDREMSTDRTESEPTADRPLRAALRSDQVVIVTQAERGLPPEHTAQCYTQQQPLLLQFYAGSA